MTSPLFGDSDAWMDEDVGVFPAVIIKEPDMTRLIRRAEAKRDGLRLWAAVQKELVKRA